MTGLNTTRGRVLATVVLLILGAAFAGLGTFGTWTSAPTATPGSINAGTITLALGTAGSADNRLTIGTSNMLPGDTVQRAVKLTNSTGDISSIKLSTSAGATPSALVGAGGLRLTVAQCTTTWQETGASAPFTYACNGGGTVTNLVADQSVIMSNVDLPGIGALVASGTEKLVFTLALPTTAASTLQGASDTITFTFTATARTGTDR
jgi:hypothetical protein